MHCERGLIKFYSIIPIVALYSVLGRRLRVCGIRDRQTALRADAGLPYSNSALGTRDFRLRTAVLKPEVNDADKTKSCCVFEVYFAICL